MRLFGFRDGKILIQAQITKINYRLLPNSSMMIGSVLRSCKNIPLEIKKDFDLYEICEEEPTSIKYSIEHRDFSMDR